MSEKEKRINMIKLFALGIKYANAAITDDDFFYSDIVGDIFDTKDGEPESIDEIFNKLSNIQNVNHIEEKKELRRFVSQIRRNNEAIELLKTRMDDLKIIN